MPTVDSTVLVPSGATTIRLGVQSVQPPPTLATLTGSNLVGVGASHRATVTLDRAALEPYTVTFTASDGGTLSPGAVVVIPIGQRVATVDTTWAAAGVGRTVSIAISPTLAIDGSPLTVEVTAEEQHPAIGWYGPGSGAVGAASTALSVRGVELAAPVTCTFSVYPPGAGTFSVSSLVLAGAEDIKTLTYTPAERGVHELRVLNDAGLLQSEPIYYVATGGVEPVPPSINQQPEVVKFALSYVCPQSYNEQNSYQRYQRWDVWPGTATAHPYRVRGYRALQGSTYTLLVDDVVVDTKTVTTGVTTQFDFIVNVTLLSAGWHKVNVGGLTGGEVNPTWFVFVRRAGQAVPTTMPVMSSTWDVAHSTDAPHAWAMVPTKVAPTIRKLTRTEFPHFSNKEAPANLVREMLVPNLKGDSKFPNRSKDGFTTTFNKQPYYFTDAVRKYPMLPQTDGPRGLAQVSMFFHVEIGLAEPSLTGPINNVYGCTPWRVFKVRNDGTVITLAGWRHKNGYGPAWQEQSETFHPGYVGNDVPHPELELVGDWSSIPPERRGFHELWGIAWDTASLAIDPASAAVPLERGLQQHFDSGPRMFVTDSQNNRVCAITFSYQAHNLPPRVTEFITGMSDPWDIQEWGDSIIVSERFAHRITQWNKETGAYERTILERNPALPGTVVWSVNREPTRLGTLAQCRAHDCLGPEGLQVQDDWLYFGSWAQKQVRRVHLVTGAIEIPVAEVEPFQGNAHYVKITVSDGTFGPRGTVFVSTWENVSPAGRGWCPDGTTWTVAPDAGEIMNGRGPGWDTYGYGGAVGIARGRMVVGTADQGIQRFSKALPSDPATNATLYKQGEDEYRRRNFNLLHGEQGFGPYGYPPPFGVNAAIDYFLTLNYSGSTTE